MQKDKVHLWERKARNKKVKKKIKKTRQRRARRGNASSLTSLRPVPYTLHSFTCSHVDGL